MDKVCGSLLPWMEELPEVGRGKGLVNPGRYF